MKTHLLDLNAFRHHPYYEQSLNSVTHKQAEQVQNSHFTATLHFPEYQNT